MNESNMENEKTPLYVAFSTQKGGVGKTTFTVLAASYLYYLKGYDVTVVDCDYPQHFALIFIVIMLFSKIFRTFA